MNSNEKKISTNEILTLSSQLLDADIGLKLRVGGMSMFPFLQNGDIALIQKLAVKELKVGNVIVFKQADKWIAHRLLKTKIMQGRLIFLTKGDAAVHADTPFTEEHYAGKIIAIFRNGEKIKIDTLLKSRYGYWIAKTSFFNTVFFTFILKCNLFFQRKIKLLK